MGLDLTAQLALAEIRRLYQQLGPYANACQRTPALDVLMAAIHARSLVFRALPGQTMATIAMATDAGRTGRWGARMPLLAEGPPR